MEKCYIGLVDYTVFQQLGIALALATLIGFEREQKYQIYKYGSFGGVRTFALIGLLGALSYILSAYSAVLFSLITGGFFVLMIAAYVMTSREYKGAGATSEVAAILVYIIGVLSAMDMYLMAVLIALVVLIILHFKDPLHKWAKHIKDKELASTIQFIIVAFVILPLLPNQGFGPYEFFNPYIVWLMVVFVSGISFFSYIAIKIFGAKRGILLTGFLSGFIATTPLAFAFAAQSKKNKSIVNPYVLAVVIAGSAMFFRLIFELLVLNRDLLKIVFIPMFVMGVVGIGLALVFARNNHKVPKAMEREMLNVKSPFSLGPALKFGAFFALILFVIKFMLAELGDVGVYLTSIISGTMDVDAITVSMATLAKTELSEMTAGIAVIIAAMINTLAKGGIFLLFGNRKVAIKIVSVFLLVILAGGLSMFFI